MSDVPAYGETRGREIPALMTHGYRMVHAFRPEPVLQPCSFACDFSVLCRLRVKFPSMCHVHAVKAALVMRDQMFPARWLPGVSVATCVFRSSAVVGAQCACSIVGSHGCACSAQPLMRALSAKYNGHEEPKAAL